MLIACIALAEVQHDNADRYLDTYFQAGIHGGVSVSKLKTTQNQKLFENLFEFF